MTAKNDLISRSEAEKLGATCLARRNEDGQLEAIISLDNAPTVEAFTKEDMAGAYNEGYVCGGREAERPHGEWIEKEETPASVSYYCSNCKMEGIPVTPFCPWCGAAMRGDNNGQ